ncbi:MAG: coagulation factor 5/8 type domain-containing protein [Verrucomicrobia bacterium]|nr:coagulation factor 5/8 type domain-containing protein [Verrucomicrobiota bacterium]
MERFRFFDRLNRSVINPRFYAKRVFCLVPKIPSRILICCLSSVVPFSAVHAADPDFGPNVTVFDPTMPASTIQAAVNAISQTQTLDSAQFDTVRHAFLFKPGTYTVDVQVGYYTSVAGLGLSPDDVTINGIVHSEGLKNSTLTNFWRSAENMHIVPQSNQTERWAVSQAGPFRRMHVSGGPLFWIMPIDGSFSSGGFIADSWIEDEVLSGSQQQWLTRNSILGNGWTNGVWNQVFSGVVGAPAQNFPPNSTNHNPYTTLPQSPVTQEKPFLFTDANGSFRVFIPAVQKNSSGTSWGNGPAAGYSIPIADFFIAQPTDSVDAINDALARGKHLILTPGIYSLDRPIRVLRPDTVVLGLGFPTLVPQSGRAAMTIADVRGVKLSGVIIDAGPVTSSVLLKVGQDQGEDRDDQGGLSNSEGDGRDQNHPTLLQDVFFRIGGATPGQAEVSLKIDSDNVIIDDLWAWRADHGNGVGWTLNTANNGVIVNGNNVTAYGLFVEHYQQYQVIWNGENGRTIFFQNEMPYDPPNQAAWTHNGINGFASYKVANGVRTHQAWGLGAYCFFHVNPSIVNYHAFEVPSTPGVQFHDLVIVSLGGVGTIDHVINDTGGQANTTTQTVYLLGYP